MAKAKQTRRRSYAPPETEAGPIRENFFTIFMHNFAFIPFFLPGMFFAWLYLAAGGWIAFVLALLLLIPAGPAVAAMYDIAFTWVGRDSARPHRDFLESYKLNFRQGALTMAVSLPFLAVILISLMLRNRPGWMLVTIAAGAFFLTAFWILSFSQIALVDLSLPQIWKNAVYLIPLMGLKGLWATLLHLIFFAVLYRWLGVTFLLFLFMGPALLVTYTANSIFPRLKELLVRRCEA